MSYTTLRPSSGYKPPVGGVPLFPMQMKIEEDGDDSNNNNNARNMAPKLPMKPPVRKVNRDNNSLLAIAQTSAEDNHDPTEAGAKLQHVTINRVSKAPGGRRPPTRRPMTDRVTVNQEIVEEDVSLVAKKAPPPSNINVTVNPNKPPPPPKPQSLQADMKRKTEVQVVGEKKVMRIFLDNKGVGFKTVQVRTTDSMYELCSTMEKKIQLQDLTGFGIYEVRDQRDVRLIDPEETIEEVMENWKGDSLFKLVYKKALGECAKKYYHKPTTPRGGGSQSDSRPEIPSKPEPVSKPPELPSKPMELHHKPPELPSKPELSRPPELPSKPVELQYKPPELPSKPEVIYKPPELPSKPDTFKMGELPTLKPELPSKTMETKRTDVVIVDDGPKNEPSSSSFTAAIPKGSRRVVPIRNSSSGAPSGPAPVPTPSAPVPVEPETTEVPLSAEPLRASFGSRRVKSAIMRPQIIRTEPSDSNVNNPSPLSDHSNSNNNSNVNNNTNSNANNNNNSNINTTPVTSSVPPVNDPPPATDNSNLPRKPAPRRPIQAQTLRNSVGSALKNDLSDFDPPRRVAPSPNFPNRPAPTLQSQDVQPSPSPSPSQSPPTSPSPSPSVTDNGGGVGRGAPLSRPPSNPVIIRGPQSPKMPRNEPNNRPNLNPPSNPVPTPISPTISPTPTPTPTPVVTPSPAPAVTEPSSAGGFTSKNINTWTVEDVGNWIDSLGFASFKPIFIENFISGKELVELTMDELKDDLGVTALGARKAILREIGELKK